MKKKRIFAIMGSLLILFVAYDTLIIKTKPIIPDNEFAFNPIPENGEGGGIEGVYSHRASTITEWLDELACKLDRWDDCTGYQVIRFYADGTVLVTSIGFNGGMDDDYLPKLRGWFNKESEWVSNGKYFVSGNRIWFSTSTYYAIDERTVTVDFSGIVIGNILILDSYSHYNGASVSKMFFVQLK